MVNVNTVNIFGFFNIMGGMKMFPSTYSLNHYFSYSFLVKLLLRVGAAQFITDVVATQLSQRLLLKIVWGACPLTC